MFCTKLKSSVLILSAMVASCDSSGTRHELGTEGSIRPAATEPSSRVEVQGGSESDSSSLFDHGEFIAVAQRYADTELGMRGDDYVCEVVAVNEVEVQVSVRTKPLQNNPGGWGDRIMFIDRRTKRVKEVLKTQ